MVLLIAGGTHTGKTLLSQRLLEAYHYPCLSIDHLKMGLIRSGYTTLTPESDHQALTHYLWPVVREMIKTAIENSQNLIVEGCYIPFGFRDDFSPEYLARIRYVCLIFSPEYIRDHYRDIVAHGSAIEARQDESYLSPELLQKENRENLAQCRAHGLEYILVDGAYEVCWDFLKPSK